MITLAPPLTTTKWRKLLVFQNFEIKATKQCLNLARYHAGLDVAGFSSYFLVFITFSFMGWYNNASLKTGKPQHAIICCYTNWEFTKAPNILQVLQFTLSGIQYKPLYTRELSQ